MTARITVEGGLTAAPELRYSSSGVAIAGGTVASTERYQDKQGEWQDGKSLYLRWSAFKDLAENIAASALDKGSQVIVSGKLVTRSYETRDGEKRSSTELEVTDFAVSLKRATVSVQRTSRGQGGTAAPAQDWPSAQAPAAADPWSTPGGFSDDSPF